jgi:flotillin
MLLLPFLPIIGAFLLVVLIPLTLRRVVAPNEVHIVQGHGETRTYGKGQSSGSAYYEWPAWLPRLGVQTIELPLSVFQIQLKDYAAYDKDKVPFRVDITAFFRVADAAKAAERVQDEDELEAQLTSILQGAARTTLSKSDIETIMVERSQYGDIFTHEVAEQLKEWGIANVKNIELMDIRDDGETKVIANIMARKESDIERHSRQEVANNRKQASVAETQANREQELAAQEAAEQIGARTALKEQNVGIAEQLAKQRIAESAALTAEKDMAVERVRAVRAAEIERDRQVVAADKERQTTIIKADGEQQQTVIKAKATSAQLETEAKGRLAAKLNEAEGIQAEGAARADAETKMQVAKGVAAQAELAKTIGENKEYQTYLIEVRKVDASRDVGIEQAKALSKADIRVISNAGTPGEGLSSARDIFSAKGGQALGSLVEAFAASPVGESILKKAGIHRPNGEARSS